ncbi:MAG: sugar phosphate isomerase/epimerase [Bacilli bacterium]|nr:sugar phosphate isomerase/epimerase [Bacilli bacterium]MDD4077508.1 sugar phosphate isomerase/epimerase [Bacilli bacterium]MDD4388584.1 sugar phosphate isomerase/epimerase [Bacilli bacterium]
MKKCFTINPLRTTEEIESYSRLFTENIYQAIEIFYPYNLDILNQSIYTENIKNIKYRFPNVEVVMHLPYGPTNDLCNPDQYCIVLDLMKKGIDYAAQFKTKKLTLHLGYLPQGMNRQAVRDHIKVVLKDLSQYAKQKHMQLMIENMPGSAELGYGPDEILSLIVNVNLPNLKFILDTGHAHLSGYSPCEYIDTLSQFLLHIHFSDNNGHGDQHARLGTGNIDFYAIFQSLKKIGYRELHCLEILYDTVEDLYQNALDIDKYDIYE